jgi:dipeptidase E
MSPVTVDPAFDENSSAEPYSKGTFLMATPNIVLGGGGVDNQAAHVYDHFTSVIHGGSLLFLPHASAPRLITFARAWGWISRSTPFPDVHVDMWERISGRTYPELDRYDGICLYGGNTYDLLGALRSTGFSDLIVEFVNAGRQVLGISAGAIVLGRDITTESLASDPDQNLHGITDLRGLDLLGGYNVHGHYESSEDNDLSEYLTLHNVPVIAIPEASGVAITGTSAHVLGTDEVHIFRNGQHETHAPNSSTTL